MTFDCACVFCLSVCRTAEWVNPVSKGLVVVSCSEGRILPYGSLEDILSRDENPKNCHTKDDRGSWFAVDLGVWVYPTAYTLRHSRGYGSRSALRNWLFQVSKDGHDWLTVHTHENDTSLGEPGYVKRVHVIHACIFLCVYLARDGLHSV